MTPIRRAKIFDFKGFLLIFRKKIEGRTNTSIVEAVAPIIPKTSLIDGTKMTRTLIRLKRTSIIPKCLLHLKSWSGYKRKVRAFLAGKCVKGTVRTTASRTVIRTVRVKISDESTKLYIKSISTSIQL